MYNRITISTWLTIARILSVPWLVKAIVWQEWSKALILLLFAAITDMLDGFLARLLSQQTTLGALLDPVADKFLTVSCFAATTYVGLLPSWFFVLSFCKEVFQIIGAAWFYAVTGGSAMHANALGKAAMVGQVLIMGWLFIAAVFNLVSSTFTAVSMCIVAVLMVLSLIVYAYQGLKRGML